MEYPDLEYCGRDVSICRQCTRLTFVNRTMAKKVTAVVATEDGSLVAGADKFGDVYTTDLTASAAAEHCLGHMSIITSMVCHTLLLVISLLTTLQRLSGKLLVTGDCDSNIRCSCFPDGFNIESFCLGHTT